MLYSAPTARSQRDVGFFVARPFPANNPLFVLRLKWADVAAILIIPLILMNVLKPYRSQHVFLPFVGYVRGTVFLLLSMLLLSIFFIIANFLRPDGDVWRAFRSWMIWLRTHNRWSARVRSEDALWTPSGLRSIHNPN